MISLGSVDTDISHEAWQGYIDYVNELTGHSVSNDKLRGEGEAMYVGPKPAAGEPKTVKQVQQFLRDSGFLTVGEADGICGYRTTSAIRLFQEHVRTVQKDTSIGAPDGVLGNKGFAAMHHWQEEGKKADWTSGAAGDRYDQGLNLLDNIKQHCMMNPSRMLHEVNEFSGKTDTRKAADWDFNPKHIHLIGIRESSEATQKKLNDVFFLLIRDMVYTFFGSTDPATAAGEGKRLGAPFLATGQHLYRFGWHKQQESQRDRVYHALKPRRHGVLAVRSPGDMFLSESDIDAGVSINHSINIHWGGSGFSNSAGWSAGCQVIAGKTYINHENELVDMGQYAASSYAELGFDASTRAFHHKGAYTVLGDLVTALSGADNTVHYTLLTKDELDVSPGVVAMITAARAAF